MCTKRDRDRETERQRDRERQRQRQRQRERETPLPVSSVPCNTLGNVFEEHRKLKRTRHKCTVAEDVLINVSAKQPHYINSKLCE